MRLSQITTDKVAEFLRLDPDEYQKEILQAVMTAAKQYILNYTGLTEEKADEKEDFYIAYMVLCQDMYDNRSLYVDKSGVQGSNTNKVVESILGMHCVNLL